MKWAYLARVQSSFSWNVLGMHCIWCMWQISGMVARAPPCKTAISSRVLLVHAAIWLLVVLALYWKGTHAATCWRVNPAVSERVAVETLVCVNIISTATMFVDQCGTGAVFDDSVVREWHHKVWCHYAIITTTTMALTSVWTCGGKCLH